MKISTQDSNESAHEIGSTDEATEIAGHATVDSQPSERRSSDGENGLDANAENGVHLPGPLVDIDEV